MDFTSVTLRMSTNPRLRKSIENDFPDFVAEVETNLECSIPVFLFHTDDDNKQDYITLQFADPVDATVFRMHYAEIIRDFGWQFDNTYELPSGQEIPSTAIRKVEANFT